MASERASSLACLLYQISTVGAPRHCTRSRRVVLFWPSAALPDDLSSAVSCPVTGILFCVASPDYAADLVAHTAAAAALFLCLSLFRARETKRRPEKQNLVFACPQNAAQPLVVPLCSPPVTGLSGPGAGEWPGQDTADGLAGVGAIQMQHRLQERSRQLHQVRELISSVSQWRDIVWIRNTLTQSTQEEKFLTVMCGFSMFPSDRLFRTMTDIVVAEGYAAVGYEYINVDDCWLEKDRDRHGQLVPDRERFPYGMKSLSDYVIQCVFS